MYSDLTIRNMWLGATAKRDQGIVYIPALPEGEDDVLSGNIYRCTLRMRDGDYPQISYDFNDLTSAIYNLGIYYQSHTFCSEPIEEDLEEIDLNEQEKQLVMDVYEKYLKGLDVEGEPICVWNAYIHQFPEGDPQADVVREEAEKRVGKGLAAYQLLMRGIRLCRLQSLGAPFVVLFLAEIQMAQTYVIHYYGKSVEEIPFLKIDGQLSTWFKQAEQVTEEDIFGIFRLLQNEANYLDDPKAGVFLFLEENNFSHGLEAYRIVTEMYDRVKPQIDEMLSKLSEYETEMLVKKYGLDDGIRRSYEEIGREYGWSKEMTECVETMALRNLYKTSGHQQW